MQNYDVRDISLAPSGHQKIEWVRKNMPLLRGLEEEFRRTKPFEGVKVSLSVHLEAKTAYLCLVLAAGGAEMSVTGSNVLRMMWQQPLQIAGSEFSHTTARLRMNTTDILKCVWSTNLILLLTTVRTWYP